VGLDTAKSDHHDDAQLLDILQDGVPLVLKPWDKIANQLGWTLQEVISRVSALYNAGLIRCISGIFDAASLGYSTALVAFDATGAEKTLSDSATTVSAHPGVSHCYARNDDLYNLWFTLAVSPQSTLGLKSTAERLAQKANVKHHLILPVIRKFKLRVRFDFDATKSCKKNVNSRGGSPESQQSLEVPGELEELKKSPLQQRTIHALQMDLPLTNEPFAELASKVGLAPKELLTCAEKLLAKGKMRRYAAGINHRAAGATTNVMIVWDVSRSKSEAAGINAASFPSVTHCYLRPPGKDWPFTLYTMIQTQSITDAREVIEQIASKIGSPPHRELWTTAEYKKSRVKLFTNDEAAWESL
jgi:siroheme decarboxylase